MTQDPIASELKYTPIDTIPEIAAGVRNAFNSHKTKSIDYRLLQLRKLYWGIKDNEAALVKACKQDLGKGEFETYLAEIDWCTNDIVFATQNLQSWVKNESAQDIPLANKLLSPRIRKDPLGAILIIGTYNFPVNLSFTPLVGAIAAGCTAILKPSESAPAVAKVMQHIIETSLDVSCFGVVQGAVPETSALLEEKWDKIFYTGSANVGKIIAKKAAETLTPVTLELGGRNPAIVTKNANVQLAAKRLLWGKIMNAGQVCISQNYIMVDKEILAPFIVELKVTMKTFFPNGIKDSDDYARIINGKQWSRLKSMLDSTKGQIIMGGDMDESQRYMEPTVVLVDSPKDPLVAEESFGPLIPILPVEDLDTAIRIANEVHRTPLGLYPFGNKRETDQIMRETQSGGVSVNDALFHGTIPTLPFGGVGDSGQGAYRGRSSFDCFTHRRSVTTTPGWMEGLLDVRYPPYEGKLAKFKKMSELKPNFDRDGKVKFSLISYILSLGAGSTTGGLVRYAMVLLAAFGIKQYMDGSFAPSMHEHEIISYDAVALAGEGLLQQNIPNRQGYNESQKITSSVITCESIFPVFTKRSTKYPMPTLLSSPFRINRFFPRLLQLQIEKREFSMASLRRMDRKRFAPLDPQRPNQEGAAPLRGIVFDVDGTLCKPQSYMFRQMREALKIPKSTDILDHIHSLPQPAQDEAQTAIRAIERAAMAEQEPQPGLNELITYLENRKVRMGLCTRNFDAPVTHLVQTFLPGKTFFPIITRDFRPPKPDPAGILQIAQAWELEDGAGSLIMVGDSIDDMTAGFRAGAATVLLSCEENEELEKHEYTGLAVRRLDDLVEILERGFEEGIERRKGDREGEARTH
ncbi:MAG: hypothetical protein Q9203_001576 [Teloschistes exilis]